MTAVATTSRLDGNAVDGRRFRIECGRDLVVLAVIWIVMAILVDPVGDFPINDDWVYGASVRSVLGGRFEVVSFSSANVGILAFWGALCARVFGFSFTVLRLSTLLLGLVGVLATYSLMRRWWNDRIVAHVAAASLAFNPIYFALACTFMTDVPFLALMLLSVLAILRGIERDDNRFVGVGLALSIVAITMRQFAIIVPAGYALAHVARRGWRWRTVVVAVLPFAAALGVHLLFSNWLLQSGRKPYPAGIPSLLVAPSATTVYRLKWASMGLVNDIGLFLLPLVMLCLPARDRAGARRSVAVWSGVAALVLAMGIVFVHYGLVTPISKNVLDWYGIGPLTNVDTMSDGVNLPVEQPLVHRAWFAMTALAVIASALVLVALVAAAGRMTRSRIVRTLRAGSTTSARSMFLVGTALAYLAILMLLATAYPLFDRYLLPLVVFAAVAVPSLIADRSSPVLVTSRWRVASAVAMLTVFAAFSIVTTHDFLAWSRVRWAALQGLVARGVAPQRIDGGYEFNAWYLYDPLFERRDGKSWWWVDDDEYVTSSGPMAGYAIVETHPVDRWWAGGGKDVYVLRRVEAKP